MLFVGIPQLFHDVFQAHTHTPPKATDLSKTPLKTVNTMQIPDGSQSLPDFGLQTKPKFIHLKTQQMYDPRLSKNDNNHPSSVQLSPDFLLSNEFDIQSNTLSPNVLSSLSLSSFNKILTGRNESIREGTRDLRLSCICRIIVAHHNEGEGSQLPKPNGNDTALLERQKPLNPPNKDADPTKDNSELTPSDTLTERENGNLDSPGLPHQFSLWQIAFMDYVKRHLHHSGTQELLIRWLYQEYSRCYSSSTDLLPNTTSTVSQKTNLMDSTRLLLQSSTETIDVECNQIDPTNVRGEHL